MLPNGFNVYPEDIENALRIAGLRDAVVVETEPGPDRGGRARRLEGETPDAIARPGVDAAVKAANATPGPEPADRRLAPVAGRGLPAHPHAQDQARPGPPLGAGDAPLPVATLRREPADREPQDGTGTPVPERLERRLDVRLPRVGRRPRAPTSRGRRSSRRRRMTWLRPNGDWTRARAGREVGRLVRGGLRRRGRVRELVDDDEALGPGARAGRPGRRPAASSCKVASSGGRNGASASRRTRFCVAEDARRARPRLRGRRRRPSGRARWLPGGNVRDGAAAGAHPASEAPATTAAATAGRGRPAAVDHPGGQSNARPPIRWMCRWSTDWPPHRPTFETSR